MSSPFIVDADESNFDYQVLAYSQKKPVIVDFWADWCDPCHRVTPMLERLAVQNQGKFRLAKVNADENTGLTKRYQVHTLPTIKAFQNGRITGELRGVQTEPQIRNFVGQIVPSPEDLLVDKAHSLLEKEEYDEVEAACRDILDKQPGHPGALLMLIKSLLAQGDSQEALRLLKGFPASPQYKQAEKLLPLARVMSGDGEEPAPSQDHLDAVYRRAIRLINMGNIPAALDGLIEVLRKDKRYLEGEAKKVILGLFELLGEKHPLTVEYRQELANILF